MENLVREMLVKMGEDPQREGLRKTPERVTKAWDEITVGYNQRPGELVRGALSRPRVRK